MVDLQLGEQSGYILDELHGSPSNRTVTFANGDSDNSAAMYRKKATFVFNRPLSMTSMLATLRSAYGLILRMARRASCNSRSFLRVSEVIVACVVTLYVLGSEAEAFANHRAELHER